MISVLLHEHYCEHDKYFRLFDEVPNSAAVCSANLNRRLIIAVD